ncbi:hypothetical protein ACYX7E_17840 [Luteimonas sp. RIT-PG2_3]
MPPASPSRLPLIAARATLAALLLAAIATAWSYSQAPQRWWSPGEGRVFAETTEYGNDSGTLRLLVVDGPMETRGHPFFEPIGDYGRACVTCHQPADGMSLSVASARAQWQQRGYKDPLFAAYDGSNCPDLPQELASSHSLLLDHGLIRIARPWPPRNHDGSLIQPDFKIEVVRDPTHCNLSPRWGLNAKDPMISVYRRPRPVANFKYILAMGFAIDPKRSQPLPLDPDSGKPVSGNLLADRRALTLEAQIRDALQTHLGFRDKLSAEDIARITDFESRIYVAQQRSRVGGELDGGGAHGGPAMLRDSPAGRLGSQGVPLWSEFKPWADAAKDPTLTPAQRAWRESVARGAENFRERTFLISDSSGINSRIGFGNPVRDRCAFCHNMSQMGMDVAPGQVDLGTTTQPFADSQPHLPLFRITCSGPPHPHYGKVIHTHDPGFALTTGQCSDVGKITLQTLRGLAARAPYFSNGSAKTLREVIEYYDRRYNIGYSEQEIQDLVHLMEAL